MGPAKEALIELLQESLHDTRKSFGMYGQIRISLTDVTTERLMVEISTHHGMEGASLARNVRNAFLNWLQDLLPVERFVAVYSNPTLGIVGEIHDLPYAQGLWAAGQLTSSVILIPENADPAREEQRSRFREAWQRFLREAECSGHAHPIV